MPIAFIGGLGIPEILVILVVALLVFGRRLPDVAKQVGKGYMQFRKQLDNLQDEVEFTDVMSVSDPGPKPAVPDTDPDRPDRSSEDGQDAKKASGSSIASDTLEQDEPSSPENLNDK